MSAFDVVGAQLIVFMHLTSLEHGIRLQNLIYLQNPALQPAEISV